MLARWFLRYYLKFQTASPWLSAEAIPACLHAVAVSSEIDLGFPPVSGLRNEGVEALHKLRHQSNLLRSLGELSFPKKA